MDDHRLCTRFLVLAAHTMAQLGRGLSLGLALQLRLGQVQHLLLTLGNSNLRLLLLSLYCLLLFSQRVFLLETPSTSQIRAVVEHVIRVRIQCPVAALSGFLVVARHFHEALVQTQVVANGVLPTLEPKQTKELVNNI